jgi:hypothetical protein
MADRVLFDTATRRMDSEADRSVSIRARKSLEQTLADVENDRRIFHNEFSRKGGRARKSDALQRVIEEIVRENPIITQNELLHTLGRKEGDGVVISIDSESAVLDGDRRNIRFHDHEGRLKTASVGGLKDRLSRAKRKIRAKRLMRRA